MAFKSYYKLVKYKDPNKIPFYVEDVSGQGGTIKIYQRLGDATYAEYSTDKENWVRVNMGNSPYTPYANVPVTANNKVYIRATATKWEGSGSQNNGMIIQYNNDYNVGGNIMSMIYGQTFTNQKEFQENASQKIFQGFFTTESHLKKADDLLLPATTLTQSCYGNMFGGCINLTAVPDLPATTLAPGCYGNMFRGCTSLTAAPALNATTLKSKCYEGMFYGCRSLTTAPELPATTLADYCYCQMFYGCSNLTSMKVAFTTWPSTSSTATTYRATYCWTHGLPASGTFYKKSGLSTQKNASGNATDGNAIAGTTNAIPYNWTVTNY